MHKNILQNDTIAGLNVSYKIAFQKHIYADIQNIGECKQIDRFIHSFMSSYPAFLVSPKINPLRTKEGNNFKPCPPNFWIALCRNGRQNANK